MSVCHWRSAYCAKRVNPIREQREVRRSAGMERVTLKEARGMQ